jgi:hypothetical protein
MPLLFAQSGLFIVSVLAMYVMFGLPLFAVIATVAAILGGGRKQAKSRFGLGWSSAIFSKTFGGLALVGGALVLAASLWAAWTIPAR